MSLARIRYTRSNDEGTITTQYLSTRTTKTHHRVAVTKDSEPRRCPNGERKGEGARLRIRYKNTWDLETKGASRTQHCGTITRTIRQRESDSIGSFTCKFPRTAPTTSIDSSCCKPTIESIQHLPHPPCSRNTNKQPSTTHHRRICSRGTRRTPGRSSFRASKWLLPEFWKWLRLKLITFQLKAQFPIAWPQQQQQPSITFGKATRVSLSRGSTSGIGRRSA